MKSEIAPRRPNLLGGRMARSLAPESVERRKIVGPVDIYKEVLK